MVLTLLSLCLNSFYVAPHVNVPLFDEEKEFTASSVAVSQDTLLSAYHVLEGDKKIYALCDNELVLIKETKDDEEDDLTLLVLSKPCESFIIKKISKRFPMPGNQIYSVGCPHAMCSLVTSGIVSGYLPPKEGRRTAKMISDVKIWFGSSGGPLLNEYGELIGITSSILGVSRYYNEEDESHQLYAQNWSLFATLRQITNFLQKEKIIH